MQRESDTKNTIEGKKKKKRTKTRNVFFRTKIKTLLFTFINVFSKSDLQTLPAGLAWPSSCPLRSARIFILH